MGKKIEFSWLQLHMTNTLLGERIEFRDHMKKLCPTQYDGGDSTTVFLKFTSVEERDATRKGLIEIINRNPKYTATEKNENEIVVKRIKW